MFSSTTNFVIISLRYGSNMKENIICTEDDKNFVLYKDKVNDRKVRFKIKDILKDHWNDFINKYKSLNIRDVVFKNVNKVLKCKTFSLGYTEYECPNCHKSLVVPNLVSLDFVIRVVINIMKIGLFLFFLNYLIILIDMLFGLFQKNFAVILEKIVQDLTLFLRQHLSLSNVGLKKNIKRIILHQHLFLYFIPMEEV